MSGGVKKEFLDLGRHPIANAFLKEEDFKDEFLFDMGPSWYWMPDIIDSFFNDFNKSTSDFFKLKKLNPAYQVYFGQKDSLLIEDSLEKICKVFENLEPGSSKKLKDFIKTAEENYNIAIKDYVYKPGISPLELVSLKTLKKINFFISNIKRDVEKKFKNQKLRQILQFPVLFLGAKPSKTPAFYNFMNYADFGLGTWHPEKGFYTLVEFSAPLCNAYVIFVQIFINIQFFIPFSASIV